MELWNENISCVNYAIHGSEGKRRVEYSSPVTRLAWKLISLMASFLSHFAVISYNNPHRSYIITYSLRGESRNTCKFAFGIYPNLII